MPKARITGCFTLGLLLMLFCGTSGQAPFNPDSLQRIVDSDASAEEKNRSILGLIEGYLKTDPGRSLIYCNNLMERAASSGDKALMAEIYWLKSRAYIGKGSYDTSVVCCDSGIIISESIGLTGLQAEINITRGNALFYSKGPEYGISSYKESYRLFSQAGDSAGLAKALNGLGVMFKKMAQYDSALTYYIQLVTLAESKGYESTLGMGYLNLGILYQDLHELDKASHYLALSIPINEKYRPDLVALAHMNIGLVNHEKGLLDTALSELRIALQIYSSLNERKYIADVYNNIGTVFFKKDELDSAYKYFTDARDLYKQLDNSYSFGQAYNNIALVIMERGEYDRALEILDTCLKYAKRTSNSELEAQVYYNMYFAYNKKSDYKKALESYLIHDSLQEIIYNLNKDRLMADLEMKYQNEKKQAQILELEKTNLQKDLDLQVRTKQRNAFLFTGIGIIALISFAFLYFRQRTVKDRIIAQQRIRQLEEEKKLLAAKSLVEGQEEERKRIARELHDGLGVLLSTTRMQFSAIRDKSPENQPLIERATKLLEQASSDVRKISHNMMPGLLTKLGLYEAVEDLFEKVSETEGLTVRAHIHEDAQRLPENDEIMVYRIIQELVNNTLKHANAKTIEIQMQVMPGHLDIIYSDDGKGFSMEEKAGSKSLGLQSIESRVNFLNGRMQLYSAPGKGVSYKFEIPM